MTSSAPADIPRAYDPASVEQRIYQDWQDAGYFTPDRYARAASPLSSSCRRPTLPANCTWATP